MKERLSLILGINVLWAVVSELYFYEMRKTEGFLNKKWDVSLTYFELRHIAYDPTPEFRLYFNCLRCCRVLLSWVANCAPYFFQKPRTWFLVNLGFRGSPNLTLVLIVVSVNLMFPYSKLTKMLFSIINEKYL